MVVKNSVQLYMPCVNKIINKNHVCYMFRINIYQLCYPKYSFKLVNFSKSYASRKGLFSFQHTLYVSPT